MLAVWLAASLLLTGCWDRIELPDLELISGAAFDAAPGGGVRLTLSIVLPANLAGGGGLGAGPTSGGGPPTVVVSATGPTIGQAITMLSQGLPGRLFWGHTRIVLVGDGLARRSIEPVLDFFLRQRTTRLSTYLAITPGEAGPLLKINPPYRIPATNVLYEHLRLGTEPPATVYRIAQWLLTRSGAVLVPEVVAGRPSVPGQPPDGGGGAPEIPTPATFLFNGAAVVGQGRLRGWLPAPAMHGAMWLLGETQQSTLVLHDPEGGLLTVVLAHQRTHRQAMVLPDGAPAIQVRIAANYAVTQVEAGRPALDNPQYMLQLSALADRAILRRTGAALAAARAEGVDFLHFGRLLAAGQPALWRRLYADWPSPLRRLRVVIRVRAHVLSTGNLVTLR